MHTGLAAWDESVFKAIHLGWKSGPADILFLILSYTGLGQLQAVVGLSFLASKKLKPYAWPILLSILFTGTLMAQGIKAAIPRDRPSNQLYAQPMEPHKKSSFPSGHTTTAFAVATTVFLVARRKKANLALAVPLYLWATGVGISRIYRGVHWPTDVLAGAMCGILGACLLEVILQAWETKQANRQDVESAG